LFVFGCIDNETANRRYLRFVIIEISFKFIRAIYETNLKSKSDSNRNNKINDLNTKSSRETEVENAIAADLQKMDAYWTRGSDSSGVSTEKRGFL
jgi:hypothetical protein